MSSATRAPPRSHSSSGRTARAPRSHSSSPTSTSTVGSAPPSRACCSTTRARPVSRRSPRSRAATTTPRSRSFAARLRFSRCASKGRSSRSAPRSHSPRYIHRMDVRSLLDGAGESDLDLWARTINPQFVRVLRTIGFDRTWARAEGAYLYDSEGTRYLDLLGGFGMYNVGRNNRAVRAALVEALELDTPGMLAMGVTALPGLLADALLARTPPRIERCLFTSSGTEANEAAFKLGRAATERARVISTDHGFHGLTLGSLSANGNAEFTARFQPLLPGFELVPFGDLDALEAQLKHEDVAVFIVEPVQGKGINIPPAGYLEGAQALCRRYGTLFCIDEVMTGFGRTGTMFAFEHWGLEPDMVTVAKSL